MTFGNLESDLGFTGPLTAIYSNASSLPENALKSFIGWFRVQISADAYDMLARPDLSNLAKIGIIREKRATHRGSSFIG